MERASSHPVNLQRALVGYGTSVLDGVPRDPSHERRIVVGFDDNLVTMHDRETVNRGETVDRGRIALAQRSWVLPYKSVRSVP